MKQFLFLVLTVVALGNLAPAVAQAQSGLTLNGVVQTDIGEPLPGATVFIQGSYQGSSCNAEGGFTFPVSAQMKLPFVLSSSYVGFETRLDTIQDLSQPLKIVLSPSNAANEVVVSASRVEERALQAPATVDKLNTQQLARLTAPDLITGLARLKGVDVTTSGMFLAGLSTRGFNGSMSERLVQLVDYADTQLPSLSVNGGNTTGLPEIDISSVEILHGPSSALYGANAFNGVILTNSKDPFKYEGVSVRLRGGNRDYVDGQLRYAQRLGRRWAFKLAGNYVRAQDWIADNEAAQLTAYAPGNNAAGSNLGYDAVNRYGDVGNKFPTNPRALGYAGPALAGQTVFMPGWSEREIIGPDTHAQLYRVLPSLHYLVTDKVKAMVEFKRTEAVTNAQFTSRYHLNTAINQYRAEVRSSNWFLRAYQTEDFASSNFSGSSYDLPFTGAFMQNTVDSRVPGGVTYAERYFRTYAALYNTYLARHPGDVAGAAAQARQQTADIQLAAGSPEYDELRQKTITNLTPGVGSGINTNSRLTDFSGQYDFHTPFADVVVGGAYRRFGLASGGSIFADQDGKRIRNEEYGGYGQVAKAFWHDKLKVTGAARVDGSQNFKTAFSPRTSLVYSLGRQQQHNFRVSYNQAYRSPTQTSQYVVLDLTRAFLLGNIRNGFQGYSTDVAEQLGRILTNSGADTALARYALTVDRLRPERVATIEVGYKGVLLENLSLDVNYYYNRYDSFIGQVRLIGNTDGSRPELAQIAQQAASPQPFQNRNSPTRIIQVQANATQQVRAQGSMAALTYTPTKWMNLTGNYTFNLLDRSNLPENFQTYYNTPKHKFNVGAYGELLKGLSYSVNYRWAEGHLYESTYASGYLSSYSSLDAQVGYALPKLATVVQLGASNLGNAPNVQVYGGPQIGRLVWAGLTVDVH